MSETPGRRDPGSLALPRGGAVGTSDRVLGPLPPLYVSPGGRRRGDRSAGNPAERDHPKQGGPQVSFWVKVRRELREVYADLLVLPLPALLALSCLALLLAALVAFGIHP